MDIYYYNHIMPILLAVLDCCLENADLVAVDVVIAQGRHNEPNRQVLSWFTK